MITTFDNFNNIRHLLYCKGELIVATSGGYDPIHPGHISCLEQSKKYGDVLVVIVNGDSFLTKKKGRSFMDLETRCKIIDSIKYVDYVIPFEIKNDKTVCKALKFLKPHIFTKGGDRINKDTIPEWGICKELDIKIFTGVGNDKIWSSSDFLNEYKAYILNLQGSNL